MLLPITLLPCDLTFLMISTLLSAAVPVVESMAALVLMDQLMAHIAQCEMFPLNIALQEPVGVKYTRTPELAAIVP